jgi:hypothetical protein
VGVEVWWVQALSWGLRAPHLHSDLHESFKKQRIILYKQEHLTTMQEFQ